MAMKKNERYRSAVPKCCCEIDLVRVIECRPRAELTLRVRAEYETDALREFSARLELRAKQGTNHLVALFQ